MPFRHLIQNLQYMMKYQYFCDINGFKDNDQHNIVIQEDQTVSYADLHVWFTNKDCSETLKLIKLIWDETPKQPNAKASLDQFLRKYAEQVIDIYTKQNQLNENIDSVQILKTSSQLILKNMLCENNNEVQRSFFIEDKKTQAKFNTQSGIDINFFCKFIEENDNIQLDNESQFYLIFAYKEIRYQVQAEILPYSNKLIFPSQIFTLNLPNDVFAIHLSLVEVTTLGIKKVIAQQNIDPFSSISPKSLDPAYSTVIIEDETDSNQCFTLQVDNKFQDKLVLQMEIFLPQINQDDSYADIICQRNQYFEKQLDKLITKRTLQNIKLELLLRPFTLIQLSEQGLHFQKIQKEKRKTQCNVCQIF